MLFRSIKAKEYGAELLLGENYLSEIDADIVFRSPGTPFYKEIAAMDATAAKILR